MKDADLKCEDIDAIVLVGASTRIPKIQQLLREKFKGKEICKTIDPEMAVVHGAAVQAAIIHGQGSEELQNIILSEIAPMTLGTASGKDFKYMMPVIERNTPIPVSKSEVYVTLCDNQTSMCVTILQGEHYYAKDNAQIGNYLIHGIPEASAGVQEVTVTYSIDANGMLAITEKIAKPEGPAIGIDLGTTHTRVAVVRDGKVEVIADEDGNCMTPSLVAVNGHDRTTNEQNTIFDVKRLIGRKFADPIVQKDMQQLPFKIVEVNEMPQIEISHKNGVKRYSAVELTANVLGRMKAIVKHIWTQQ